MAAILWEQFSQIATESPNHPAILKGQDITTLGALLSAAHQMALKLDVAPQERVLVSYENSTGFAALVGAIWARGAIPVIVNDAAPKAHLAHAIATTDPAQIFADPSRSQGRGLPIPDLVFDAPADLELSAHHAAPTDPASVLFTSGSTGLPKGVAQSAENLLSGAERIEDYLGYKPDDRILCGIPFAFDYGWGQLLSLLLRGTTLVLPEPGNAMGLCAALERHAPTILAGVPALFADLCMGLAPIQTTSRDSIRLITNTGSKIPQPVFEKLQELFPDAALSLNYGLTETYRSATLPVSEAHSHPNSVGYAVPGADLVILREDGTRAEPGEEGEIIHRGAGVFLGYWGDPERTAEVLRPDPLWNKDSGLAAPMVVHTGDLGHQDAQGRLFIHGRRDSQLKSMGVRVAPDEIEALLLDSGEVHEVAVSARPHDTLGDMIVAFVVLKGDPKAALKALKAHARENMSAYMQPRLYLVEPHALPRNSNEKIDYQALKTRAKEGV